MTRSGQEPVMIMLPGQDEYFLRVGDRVDGPASPPPALTEEEQAERRNRAAALAADYRTELLIG